MIIIPVSERRRLVIGAGVKKEGEDWIADTTKKRIAFQKLKKGEWVPAKGIQFDQALTTQVAEALSNG